METPPNAHRAIGEATTVQLSLRDQLKLLATVIAITAAAVLWASNIDQRQKRMEEKQAILVAQVAAIMDALGVRLPTPPTAAAFGPPKPNP